MVKVPSMVVFLRFVAPVAVRFVSVVSPVTPSVPARFVAPETVSEFSIVSEPSLTPIPTARLRVPSALAKIIS